MGAGLMLERARGVWRGWRARYPWLDHALRAYARYQANQGDHQAAAITFFSFLSLFPLLLLGVSVLGYLLVGNPGLQASLIRSIAANVPGNVVSAQSLDRVVAARGTTGVIGLVTLALSGAGWVDNLRSAVETVWGRRPSSRNFLLAKGADLVVLVLLAITLSVSFALTGAGTTLTGVLLSPLGLEHTGWAPALATALGLGLAVGWDTAAFSVVLLRLPRVGVSRRSAVQGSALAAVGFELLKIGASYYLSRLTGNPAVAGLGASVGLLIWLMLVSRYLLYCAAWTATLPAEAGTSPVLAVAEAADAENAGWQRAGRPDPQLPPAVLAGGLLGAGAVLGVAGIGAARLLRRRRRRPGMMAP